MSTHHTVSCRPEHCHWGFFDSGLPPAATVASGDTVTFDCVSGGRDVLPSDPRFEILADHRAIHEAVTPRLGAHILTGPVAVEGATPGDVLQIDILSIEPRQNWGYTRIRPLAGTLPEDFPIAKTWHSMIDRQRGVATLPIGIEIELAPFFGVMGVAPRPVYGACSSIQPREFGGNMDLKELVAGTTLYLPVWAPGALFSVGDGHGVQGDGEVCVTALEMCLTGTFTFTLHKGGGPARPALAMPRAETPTQFISMGLNEDLDQAMKQALREMISFICSRSNLSREQAYQFCSLAVDFHVTQTVNGEKGIHGMLKKGLLF